ncbi:MAG: hypothetical protein KatS3mg108_3587 [Isosphaeraceae bacterium]|jgi:hypothetical protein|nr:MAG: hypothetical protein KatS3mg108_3587 [Isosphaeraceae bacterium]
MRRTLFGPAALALIAFTAPFAHAQWGYPFGYGGFGWGGFSPAVGYGIQAAGLGMMASGIGNYNLQTAEAARINVNTVMNLNEYMYESLRQMNRERMQARLQRQQNLNQAMRETQERLRSNPTQQDIYSGDALNVLLTELSDPRYAAIVEQYAARIKIPGSLIRGIPFNYARAAVTFGLDKLTNAQPGPILSRPEFADDLAEYRRLGALLREQAKDDDKVDPETVNQFQAVIQRAADKLKTLTGVDEAQRMQAQVRIKALLGLSHMLEGPSLDIFLAELRPDQEVGLDRLLAFMRSFNLRFGTASNANQRQTYDQLWPKLVELRDEVFGAGTGTLPTDPPRAVSEKALEDFYSGMHPDELHPDKKPGPPPPPQPAES